MKIIFVSAEYPIFPNQATGGIGTYLSILATALARKGYKITVITRGKSKKKFKNLTIIPVTLGIKKIQVLKKTFNFKIIHRLLNFIEYPILFSIGVYQILKKLKDIDIIEGNDFAGELFFYLLLTRKRPVVVLRLHTPSFVIQKYNQEPKTLFYQVLGFLEKYCIRKANSLYSPSKDLARIIKKETNKKTDKIIPYPFKLLKKVRIKRQSNLVLYVGKLQRKKGVFTLLKAIPYVLKKYPQTRFLFVGPDTLDQGKSVKNELINKVKQLKIEKSVEIRKPLDKNSLTKLYLQATVLVIPSHWENFPHVCLEAMSLNCPVIASNTGGLKEILTNRFNGLLFSNELELEKALIILIENTKLREKLSRNAFDFISKLKPKKIITLTIKFYQKTICDFN